MMKMFLARSWGFFVKVVCVEEHDGKNEGVAGWQAGWLATCNAKTMGARLSSTL